VAGNPPRKAGFFHSSRVKKELGCLFHGEMKNLLLDFHLKNNMISSLLRFHLSSRQKNHYFLSIFFIAH
jgi:hypothetical protein